MPERQSPIEAVVRQINTAIAAVGLYLSEDQEVEAWIPLLRDLNELRAKAQEIGQKHTQLFEVSAAAEAPVVSLDVSPEEEIPSEEAPKKIEERPEETIVPAPPRPRTKVPKHTVEPPPRSPRIRQRPEQPVEGRRRGRPSADEPAADFTPLAAYRPFVLRAVAKLPGARLADIQNATLEIMKEEGVARPMDEESVGPSGTIRFKAQTQAAKKQLLKDAYLALTDDGLSLTEKGKEELLKIA